jgi:hypothetical protein
MTDEISSCHMCGRSIIAKRFCSDRCRAACDSGFPRPDPLYDRKVAASKLAGWMVIAPTADRQRLLRTIFRGRSGSPKPGSKAPKSVEWGMTPNDFFRSKYAHVFNGLQGHFSGPTIPQGRHQLTDCVPHALPTRRGTSLACPF